MSVDSGYSNNFQSAEVVHFTHNIRYIRRESPRFVIPQYAVFRIIDCSLPLVYPSTCESTPCVLHGLSACQVMLLLDPSLHHSRRAPRFPLTPSLANFTTRLRGLSNSWNQTSMCSYKTPVLR